MIQGLIGQWQTWAPYNPLAGYLSYNKRTGEAQDSFSKSTEKPSMTECLNKLPEGTKARQTLSQIALFDALDLLDNREFVFPGNLEARQNAYGVLKAVLASDVVKEILNTPINKKGDYPMDLAAQSGKPLAMKLLADSGARVLNNWDSVKCLGDVKYSEKDKALLYQNKDFLQLLAMIKQSPVLGRLQDKKGNTLLHHLLEICVPEDKNHGERTEHWLKTLKSVLDCPMNINVANHKGKTPLALADEYRNIHPKTVHMLEKARARVSNWERPELHTGW